MIMTQETNETNDWLSQITVADAGLGLVVLLAAILRLIGLGQLPMSPNEAQAALSVWQFWQNTPMTVTAVSPAYFSFSALLSQLVGFGDATMRLVPAFFGLGLVALPWLLRRRLGVIGAGVMSFMLAISPLQTILSRTAGGDTIALFALLLLLIAWWEYQETAVTHWLYGAAIALGLGLASSPLFYSGLLTLILVLVLNRFLAAHAPLSLDASTLRTTAVVAVGVLTAVSTLLLWYPAGLGSAAQLVSTWLGQFGATTQRLTPYLILGRYEILIAVLGLPLLAWGVLFGDKLAGVATQWLLLLLLFVALQPITPANAALITLPAYLLLAIFASYAFHQPTDRLTFWLAGAVVFFFMFAFIHFARYSRIAVYTPEDMTSIWLGLVAVVFALSSIIFVATLDVPISAQGTLIGVLLFMLFYQWGIAWQLGHLSGNDPRERWVTTAVTDDDVRLLTNAVQEISRQTINSNFDLDIFSTVDTPVLRWYFRAYPRFQIGDTLPAGAANQLIITPQATDTLLGNDYLSTTFVLLRSLPLEVKSEPSALNKLHWWFFHEPSVPYERTNITVWVRSDLTQSDIP